MKNLKFLVGAFLMVVLVSAFSANKASAQTTTLIRYTNTFAIGTTPSTPISTAANWSVVTSIPTFTTGSSFLNYASVLTPAGQTVPTVQNVINQMKARYDANGNVLSDFEQIQVFSGATLLYTITVRLKA